MAKPTKPSTNDTASVTPALRGAALAAASAKKPAEPRAARRSGKPSAWYKFARALERAEVVRQKAVAVVAAAIANESAKPGSDASVALLAARGALGSASFTGAVPHLQVIDSERVPAGRPPKAPRFKVGDAVRVAKKFLPKYTGSGLYAAAFLSELVVDKIAPSGREYLCRDPEGSESLHVRYGKHLEAR